MQLSRCFEVLKTRDSTEHKFAKFAKVLKEGKAPSKGFVRAKHRLGQSSKVVRIEGI